MITRNNMAISHSNKPAVDRNIIDACKTRQRCSHQRPCERAGLAPPMVGRCLWTTLNGGWIYAHSLKEWPNSQSQILLRTDTGSIRARAVLLSGEPYRPTVALTKYELRYRIGGSRANSQCALLTISCEAEARARRRAPNSRPRGVLCSRRCLQRYGINSQLR